MDIRIIDAHTHMQFPEYDADRGAVIARAHEAGIGMINAGASLESSRAAVELAHAYDEGVWATTGLHPHELEEASSFGEIARLAADPKAVGIGECGLDYFRLEDEPLKELQKSLFMRHIELAHELRKPLVIHCRQAFGDTIAMLREHKGLLNAEPGIIHFFTGTPDDAKALLDLNFSFTFGGLVTFNREFDEAIKAIPRDRVLIETDAPYVSPIPYRGTRNESLYVEETLKKFAELWHMPPDEAAPILLASTRRVFNIPA
jgi:TatD DNase family protein